MSTDHSSVEDEVAGTEVDKINTGALGTLVAVGLFAMLSITAAVTALVRHDIEAEEAIKDADANQVVTELKAAQHESLTGPAKYVDRGKGIVTLPIDIAKDLVVAELKRDPSSATPPAPPKPDASATLPTDTAAGGAPAAEGKGGALKPEQGREEKKPAPGSEGKPTPLPKPTPTAATPRAQEPGPLKK